MLPQTLQHYTPQLNALGLLSEGQCAELLRHCVDYPLHHLHKIFFEYQLNSGKLDLAGYGHGYAQHDFTALLADPVFSALAMGEAVHVARQNDPFLAERLRFLDLFQTPDPEWIEYDYDGAFRHVPAVFFRTPNRYLRWPNADRLAELSDILRPVMPEARDHAHSFTTLFEHLVQRDGARGNDLQIYRVGRCTERAQGWLKFILSGVQRDTLHDLQALGFAGVDTRPIERAYSLYPDQEHPQIALSVDVHHGVVAGFDVECPYFDTTSAQPHLEASQRFSEGLVHEGLLDPELALQIQDATHYAWQDAPDHSRGVLLLNHYKFGVWGRTNGRIKAYFELIVNQRPPHLSC